MNTGVENRNARPRHASRGPLFKALAWLLMFCIGGLVALVLCETVIMRYLLAPSDLPAMDFVDGVIKYRPEQRGVYRQRNEVEAPYRINASGWNSGHASYAGTPAGNRKRVLILGDSYVEAFQVPFDASMAEELERAVGAQRVQVFRMGMSGAPLSQYVHMLRREGLGYRPDVVIVAMVHNDFHQSFNRRPGRYTDSFRLLQVADGRVVGEQPVRTWREDWREWIRQLAMVRYLYYRWGVTPQTVLRGIRSADAAQVEAPSPRFEANVDMSSLQGLEAELWIATRHLFLELRELSVEHGFRLLLLMDADRDAIYRDRESTSRALQLNALVGRLANELGIELLDLQAVFRADYLRHARRFEFEHDGHWNAYAHRRVAQALRPAVERLIRGEPIAQLEE